MQKLECSWEKQPENLQFELRVFHWDINFKLESHSQTNRTASNFFVSSICVHSSLLIAFQIKCIHSFEWHPHSVRSGGRKAVAQRCCDDFEWRERVRAFPNADKSAAANETGRNTNVGKVLRFHFGGMIFRRRCRRFPRTQLEHWMDEIKIYMYFLFLLNSMCTIS